MNDYHQQMVAEGEFWDKEFLSPDENSFKCFWHDCGWIQEHITRDLIDRTVSLAGAGKNVLDLGCGNGWLTFFLASTGSAVEGVDVATACLERNQKKAERIGLGNVSFRYFDGNNDTLPESKYDLVVSWGTLHHIIRLDHLLEAMSRSLKPSSRIVIFECVDLHGFRGKLAAALADICHFLLPTDRTYLEKIRYLYRKTFHKEQELTWSPFEMAGGGRWKELLLEHFTIEYKRELIGFISPFINRLKIPTRALQLVVPLLFKADNCLLRLRILKPEYYYMILRKKE